jgi:nitroreductase
LEAGRVAPTAANRQPQELIVIQDNSGLDKLKKVANIYNAPLAIIVCGNKNTAYTRPPDGENLIDIDTSIVTDHMMLQATELGLGSIWVCYFHPDAVREVFNLPKHIEPINILGIGYSSGTVASPERHDKTRKPLSSTVSYEIFQH